LVLVERAAVGHGEEVFGRFHARGLAAREDEGGEGRWCGRHL
jgi:hypothetical protein